MGSWGSEQLRGPVAAGRAARHAAERDRRDRARRPAPGPLLDRRRAPRGRRGRPRRAHDRAGAHQRRAQLAPARRDRDPPPAGGGSARHLRRRGRRGAGPRHARGDRGRDAPRCCCATRRTASSTSSTVGADGDVRGGAPRPASASVPAQDFRAWRIAARQPKPIFVENARASRLLPPDLVEALSLKSYVVVPLVSATRPLGLVILQPLRRRPAPGATRSGGWSSSSRSRDRWWSRTPRCGPPSRSGSRSSPTRPSTTASPSCPNRALFADRLEHALERTHRRKAAVAVLFLDLDDFKPINDNFGHDAGDQLLTAVAQRIKACVRPEDTVARLGGDEFTVLLEDIADVRYAIAVAERIEASLRDPSASTATTQPSRPASGSRSARGRESTPEDLLRDSDGAMYQAKRKGRARHEVFRPPAADDEPAEAGAAETAAAERSRDDLAAAGSTDRGSPGRPGDGGGDLDRGGARGGARGGTVLEDEPEYADTAGRRGDEDPEADRFDEAEAVALDEPAEPADADRTGTSRSRSPTRSTSSRRRRIPAAGRAPRGGGRRTHGGPQAPAPAVPAPPLAPSRSNASAAPIRSTTDGWVANRSLIQRRRVRVGQVHAREPALHGDERPRLARQLAASMRRRRPRPRATAGSTRPPSRTRPAPAPAQTPAARRQCPGAVPARALQRRVSSITTSIAPGATIATHSMPALQVAVLHVTQLVRHHEAHLVRREAVQQRVVQHHALRVPEPAHVRVGAGRPPGCVDHEHLRRRRRRRGAPAARRPRACGSAAGPGSR